MDMTSKLVVMGGDPVKGLAGKGGNSLNNAGDIRDNIGVLVGGGYTNLSDDTARANFNGLVRTLGLKKAQDLTTHILRQNQRPEFQSLKPVDRISRFYDIQSPHVPTNEILQNIKSLGTGPRAGYTDSISLDSQQQQGNNVQTPAYGGSLAALKQYFGK